MTRLDAHERHSLLRRIFTMTTRADADAEHRGQRIHEIEFADLGGLEARAEAKPAAPSDHPLERLLFATALDLAIEAGGRWVSETRPNFHGSRS